MPKSIYGLVLPFKAKHLIELQAAIKAGVNVEPSDTSALFF